LSREIKVEISPDGSQIKIEGHGFTGPGCEEFVDNFAEALGSTNDEGHKDEYYLEEHLEANT